MRVVLMNLGTVGVGKVGSGFRAGGDGLVRGGVGNGDGRE